MKNTLLISLLSLFIISCNSVKDDKEKVQIINANGTTEMVETKDLSPSDIVHDSLTNEQLEKIKKIQSTFEEVYAMSLEETIINFKRDQNPDSEIIIWLQMADAYNNFLNENKDLNLSAKKEAFMLILSRSMMSEKEALQNVKLTTLNEKQAKEVLSFYTTKPEPLNVISK